MCDIDDEPLHRYHKGGYHPAHLGDLFDNGRYKILHKLGWGSYSTVWAARDQRFRCLTISRFASNSYIARAQTYVAIKVSVAEKRCQNQECSVLRAIAAVSTDQPGCQYLASMQDHFRLDGSNGTHDCLVLELLGPSISDVLDSPSCNERLPGRLAEKIAKQALLGLCYLHGQDLHTRNLVFAIFSINALSEESFYNKLGKPEKGLIRRHDQKTLEPCMPRYLVEPSYYPRDLDSSFTSIRIVDFGQSFWSHGPPSGFNTPLPVRAPEIIFKDKVDYRVDLWSMVCMLFELIVGQTLFDSFMKTPAILVRQMLDMAVDGLPKRWEAQWRTMNTLPPDEQPASSL